MQAFIIAALVALAAADTSLTYSVPATTVLRAPAQDSAVIQTDRVGGNFAYSVAENPAYKVVSPVVSHVSTPVATSYSIPATASVVTSNVHQTVPTTYAAVSNVHQTVPTTYAAGVQTYAAWPQTNWQLASAPVYYKGDSSPIIYNSEFGVQKKIDQVHHQTVQVQQPTVGATTYTVQHQQPAWVSSPVAATYAVQPNSVTTVGKTATTLTTAPWAGNTLTYAAGQPWAVNNWNANWNPNTIVV